MSEKNAKISCFNLYESVRRRIERNKFQQNNWGNSLKYRRKERGEGQ